jgi:hypothetical protein
MVKVDTELNGESLESAVEKDIRRFEAWFQTQGNDPLVRSEVAILKTYLFFKTRVSTEG